jgi:hypothetical protein
MSTANTTTLNELEQISINDFFGSNNAWARRILGIDNFQKTRDITQVENEYNLDKYKTLLAQNCANMEEYKRKEFELAGLHPVSGQVVISIGDDIFKTSVANLRERYYQLIRDTLRPYTSPRMCELGCGYGYNLGLIEGECYGGEYSENAVVLANKLGKDVVKFNYYTAEDYNLIRPNSTVFTVHSIEQIPDATAIINGLRNQKDKINYLVHIEPSFVKERTSLIGLLRNKYIELNDYNRNLIQLLTTQPDIEVLHLQTDVFGLVPLNSSNVIAWRFR